ncbi:MAG: RNA chaperone Hfq [Clostridium sp.]|uniref:RNA chaperone Hfq n=1 Tax=Clostridium sp. TaxID=1506 RepID=UPI0025C2C298|nr:RNA chaperone Hfq [Clostridium sp.]MCE5219714.1 RNA chaperone Hfq [Clostridium sp.]
MVNKQQSNLQDIFLNNARKEKIQLTIHLLNGFQLKGIVRGFDNFTVILECDNKQMLIYKHSISTITPIQPILFANNEYENN